MRRFHPWVMLSAQLVLATSFVEAQPRNPEGQAAGEEKHSVRVGQLQVTVTSAGAVAPHPAWGLTKPPKSGHHYVVVSLRVKNVSPYPNCTDFLAKLQVRSGRTYRQAIWRAPDPPETERLPWQGESSGSYVFQVRDGEDPVALALERNFIIERECWGRHDFSPDTPFSTTVWIPLEGLPTPPEQSKLPAGLPHTSGRANLPTKMPPSVVPSASGERDAQRKSELRVFLTDSKSWKASGGFANNSRTGAERSNMRPPKAEVLKAFRERCPEVVVTMQLERAEYIVTLDHGTWQSPPYKVSVFTRDGDSIYSGGTQLLGNAVKDACQVLAARK